MWKPCLFPYQCFLTSLSWSWSLNLWVAWLRDLKGLRVGQLGQPAHHGDQESRLTLEIEIECCHCDCRWERIPQLIKQLPPKLIISDDMTKLLFREK